MSGVHNREAYWQGIADRDVQVLKEKNKGYKDSWKKRGGIGAFMMLARKWDRIEALCEQFAVDPTSGQHAHQFDIFVHALADNRDETILEDIGDLRRYLILVEEEVRRQHDDCTNRSSA